MLRIAVDGMGGDHGLLTTLPACLQFLQDHPATRVLLVGRQQDIDIALDAQNLRQRALALGERLEIVHASERVEMDDAPAVAMRNKRDSSMRVALNLIKEGRADACVSAGNTGALMAISRFVLKTLDGIDRPAIASQLPNQKGGSTIVLDLGANVDCGPEHLLQFAQMGSALATCLNGQEQPSVGLLNIGEELIKGNDTVKRAAELLRASGLNFFGNVEGNDIYKGTTDVVVCDGFVGNVLLKTSEGLAQMLGQFIKEAFSRTLLTRLLALLAYPVLSSFKARVDHRRYNGASLIGLRGVVVKSHGSADALAFGFALKRASDAAGHQLVERIAAQVARTAVATEAVSAPALQGDASSQNPSVTA